MKQADTLLKEIVIGKFLADMSDTHHKRDTSPFSC